MADFDTPERVHYAMLQGQLPRITMMQCAHTWGAQTVMDLAYSMELRGDMKAIGEVLWEFNGETPLQKAQAAVEHIEWLRMALKNAETHERAVLSLIETERARGS